MKILVKTLLISTLFMFSCAKTVIESTNMNISALKSSDLLGQWKLKSFSDGKAPAYDITLELKDENGKYTLNGRSSVNFYFASFETDESKKTFKVSVLGSTKIAGTLEANQFEMIYYENIRNIERYEFKDINNLVLYLSSPAKEAMYFERK